MKRSAKHQRVVHCHRILDVPHLDSRHVTNCHILPSQISSLKHANLINSKWILDLLSSVNVLMQKLHTHVQMGLVFHF